MEIAKNTVVTLNYTVKDPDGNIIDDGHHPLVYLHGGYDGIFTVIEEALHGKKTGDSLQVKLLPEDAFGEFDEELVLVEDASLFPDNIEVGMSFERVGEDGEEEMIYRITDIADGKVVVDGNHMLAGQNLKFNVEVIALREATEEELAHGHVHGAHDHDHDHDHEGCCGGHGHEHGEGGCGGHGGCGCH